MAATNCSCLFAPAPAVAQQATGRQRRQLPKALTSQVANLFASIQFSEITERVRVEREVYCKSYIQKQLIKWCSRKDCYAKRFESVHCCKLCCYSISNLTEIRIIC